VKVETHALAHLKLSVGNSLLFSVSLLHLGVCSVLFPCFWKSVQVQLIACKDSSLKWLVLCRMGRIFFHIWLISGFGDISVDTSLEKQTVLAQRRPGHQWKQRLDDLMT